MPPPVWPPDAHPAHPLHVGLRAGAFEGLALGESTADARRALPGDLEGSTPPVTPLDAPSAPIGVSYYPADTRGIRGRGVSALTEHGHVVTLFITDPRAEGMAGVGVGDSLRSARARLRGLVCHPSNEGQRTCAGRVGRFTVMYVGDPIRTITLAAIDTGWCLGPVSVGIVDGWRVASKRGQRSSRRCSS